MSEQLEEVINQVKYKIEKSKKTNEYTFYLENEQCKKYILSKYTPREDAVKLLDLKEVNKNTIFFLFGLGCGYILDEIRDKVGEEAKIFIIEPSESFLKEQIQVLDKENISKEKNTFIFTGTNFDILKRSLEQYIPIDEIMNLHIITLNNYLEFYRTYYNQVLNLIKEDKSNKQIRFNTLGVMKKHFVNNRVKNRYAIAEGCDITSHRKKYAGIPAVVVSGGPSLSKNIKYLKEFKGLIFTGGRTLGAILNEGVEPDFVCSLDPQPLTYNTFGDAVNNDFPLITLDKSAYSVVAANKGPKYFLGGDEDERSNLIGVKMPVVMSIGGSVATLCLSAAEYMGCSPIIFIGQDLAYTDMKLHANECSIEESNDFDLSKQEVDRGFVKIPGYTEEVWSDAVFISYLRWIEEFINIYSGSTYINATEGGAKIEGTLQMPFKEVVDKYKSIVKPVIEHKRSEEVVDVDWYLNESINNLKIIAEKSKKAERLADGLIKEYEVYHGIRIDKINNLNKKLDELDKGLLEINRGKDIATYMFNSAYLKINIGNQYKEPLEESKEEAAKRILKYSRAIYDELYRATKEVVEYIEDEIENQKQQVD